MMIIAVAYMTNEPDWWNKCSQGLNLWSQLFYKLSSSLS